MKADRKTKQITEAGGMRFALAAYSPVADAIASLFSPFAEAVVHDLTTNTIAHISNPFSPRKVGDPSDLKDTLSADGLVIGPYERTNFDGRRLKSITVVLRDADGNAFGLLCINADVTEFEAVRRTIQAFLGHAEPTDSVQTAFHDDWHEKINRFIAAWTSEHATTIQRLDKAQRRELIQTLYEAKGFENHRAASYVANLLGVSRATVYNELARVRSKEPE
jgi:predicted transcriptional regulator YheO